MTLLVLGLAVPAAKDVTSESDLGNALLGLLPSFVTYVMSFLTAGIFWVGHQTQISQLQSSDRNLTWMYLAFLLFVTLLPFSTQLLARFIELRAALLVYWFNIALLGLALYVSANYAVRHRFFRGTEDEQRTTVRLLRRRIYVAQALYAGATVLCVVNTYVSIALIVLVQLNYVIAPPIPILRRL